MVRNTYGPGFSIMRGSGDRGAGDDKRHLLGVDVVFHGDSSGTEDDAEHGARRRAPTSFFVLVKATADLNS